MLIQILLILLSLILLFAGAEGLVRGSASLARRAGVSALLVGLTVVSFGTSSPELVVSLNSALDGQGDLAVGNVVGSNIFNIGIILGLTALICPVPVHRQIIRIDAPIAVGVAILVPLLLLNARVSRFEGALLVAGILAYTLMNVYLARKGGTPAASAEVMEPPPAEDVPRGHWLLDVVYVIAGLAILIVGSRLLVTNAVELAKGLGVSEAIIGLTIVAAGTSMPELATSVVAAIRRQPDIAVGNVVGSNVFNILAILGFSSLTMPLAAPGISGLDLGVMIALTVLLLPLLYTGRILHRVEGLLLLACYGGYLFILWP
jgi:cation:H+ antiporter